MDGVAVKKSTSFESLVIQNVSNINELKDKLQEIISAGKSYEYDVSPCLKTLLNGSDQVIVLLCIKAISELAKCEAKREMYSDEDFVIPILKILSKEMTTETVELCKQCCRALGNLCCDCDKSRRVILKNDGPLILLKLLDDTMKDDTLQEMVLLISKTLLNYVIGGCEFSESIVKGGGIHLQNKILMKEREKDEMNDEAVMTALLILSVINENAPEFLFEAQVNKTVLDVLRETTSIGVSELCLEHLHVQAEHDSVKTLLGAEGGVLLVCERLEQLMQKHKAGYVDVEEVEVEAVVKLACDLIIIVLTGDEAMHALYKNGDGEVYNKMVLWLESTNHNLLSTAVLAIGNFARKDEYCIQMMEKDIYNKLLDVFEAYHEACVRAQREVEEADGAAGARTAELLAANRVQHAAASALRNLSVPAHNKRAASARAAPLLLRALPAVRDHQLAYKLLGALRLLLDGQECVARLVLCDAAALRAAARWARAGHAGAEGEAPRLLARAVRLQREVAAPRLLQVEGCVASLVGMLAASHAVMQNEAILALTLLSLEVMRGGSGSGGTESEARLVSQLVEAEVGRHVSLLIETNCAKMPAEVAENLLALVELLCACEPLAAECARAGLRTALRRLADTRQELGEETRRRLAALAARDDL